MAPSRRTTSTDRPLATVIDDQTLAAHLGWPTKTLWYVVMKRHEMYEEHMLTGGRRVFVPNRLLRVLQPKLRARVLTPLAGKLGPHVTAHQAGRSTLDAAALHLRACEVCDATTRPNTNVVKHACPRAGAKFGMELKDFFLSTRRRWIREYFHGVVGLNENVSCLLGHLLTTDFQYRAHRKRTGVPPGALTSGEICNLVADSRLDGPIIAAMPGWRYTRHEGSLYFSNDSALPTTELMRAAEVAADVIKAAGYRVSWKKLRLQHSQRPQRLLGININRKLNIPANQYRQLHHLLYHAKKNGFAAQLKFTKKASVEDLHKWIDGKLNYFHRFAPEKTAKLQRLYEEAKSHGGRTTGPLFGSPLELEDNR
jgi:hypothetical protein